MKSHGVKVFLLYFYCKYMAVYLVWVEKYKGQYIVKNFSWRWNFQVWNDCE